MYILYPKDDFRSMSLGMRRSKSWGNLGYHDFIVGSDILLIKATFMCKKVVSHSQICGVVVGVVAYHKKKVGLANLSPSLCRVRSPNLGFLKKPTCLSIVMIDMLLWCTCLKRWTIGRLNGAF